MIRYFMLHDIVEANGKTIRENNLALLHHIPIGTLVEAEWQNWHGEGACWTIKARLWVVAHRRDCDGTPLYSLSRWRDPEWAMRDFGDAFHDFGEDDLKPIELTPQVTRGDNMPTWWQERE